MNDVELSRVVNWGGWKMETFETIMNRRSIRNFQDKAISDEILSKILQAGMAGPTCVNARDWSFIVVREPEMLNKMADANGKAAEPLRKAKLGILVCGDLERAFPLAQNYWVIDGSIAAQNMILVAFSLGIGSVWLGTWPQMDRVDAQRKLFRLPENIVPHSVIAFGYPAEDYPVGTRCQWEDERVHFEKW